jgi:cysteinyl-tRNA synthetase
MNRDSVLAAAVLSFWVAAACAGAPMLAPSVAPFAARASARAAAVELPQSTLAAAERRRRIGEINNWGYWLSSLDVGGAASAPHDLLVVDSEISADRTFEREYRSDEVAQMKRRPGSTPRLVLAYLSIGEAERYRPYWQQAWYDAPSKPAWLDKENRRWAGNFAVRYWDPQWQQLIFGTPDSYLDRIVAQGFDGVYLDRADAFFQWRKLQPTARADMVSFIARLAEHARKLAPEFLVVMQNAEELLEDAPVLDAIDAIAKEDLLFGVRRAEEPNKPDDVVWSMELLRSAQSAGRKVLVVEYLKDRAKMATAASRIREEGFIPYFAPRQLHCLNPPAVSDAAGSLPEHRCR